MFIECLIIHVAMSLRLCHYRSGHLTVVQYLVEMCSADVNLKDNEGCTPLHDVCWRVNERIHSLGLVKCLSSRKVVTRSMSELVYVLYGTSFRG